MDYLMPTFDTNNLYTVIWFQAILLNANSLQIIIWFQVTIPIEFKTVINLEYKLIAILGLKECLLCYNWCHSGIGSVC